MFYEFADCNLFLPTFIIASLRYGIPMPRSQVLSISAVSNCHLLLLARIILFGGANVYRLWAGLSPPSRREPGPTTTTLLGTARFNVRIREKIRFQSMEADDRARIPAWLRGVPAFYNHSNLAVLNKKAAEVGCAIPNHYFPVSLIMYCSRFFLRIAIHRHKILGLRPLSRDKNHQNDDGGSGR